MLPLLACLLSVACVCLILHRSSETPTDSYRRGWLAAIDWLDDPSKPMPPEIANWREALHTSPIQEEPNDYAHPAAL